MSGDRPAKRSDISDRDALMACWPWGDPRMDGGALASLLGMGYPPKVAMRKLEQLVERGWADYGVSIAYTWRTPEGEDALARLDSGATE